MKNTFISTTVNFNVLSVLTKTLHNFFYVSLKMKKKYKYIGVIHTMKALESRIRKSSETKAAISQPNCDLIALCFFPFYICFQNSLCAAWFSPQIWLSYSTQI